MDSDTETISQATYIRALIIFLESIIGLCLNAFVALALYKSSKTITPSIFLYINLLVSDTIMCLISTFLHGHRFFTAKIWPYSFCQADGFIIQAFEGMTVFLIFLQLVNPFRIIVFETLPLDNRQLAYILIGLWIGVGGLLPSVPFISGDGYHDMPSQVWCHLNYQDPKWGSMILIYITIISLCMIPIALLGSYLWMWRRMVSSRTSSLRAREKEIQWIVLRQGILLFVSFAFSWTYPTVILVGRYFANWQVTPDQDFAVAVLGLSANVLNPVILFLTNDKIRKSACKLIGLGRCIKAEPARPMDNIDGSQVPHTRKTTKKMTTTHLNRDISRPTTVKNTSNHPLKPTEHL